MKELLDSFNRVHNYLRFSITDKCNLNCIYCNPSIQKIKQLKNTDILSVKESYRLIKIFVDYFGFKKIRFTGGEPLARKDILELISLLQSLHYTSGLEIGITTNGTLLKDKLDFLKNNGVTKLNISLDSLNQDKFKEITGKNKLLEVLSAIDHAEDIGYESIKINCVVLKGLNDNEILDFVEYIKDRKNTVRFIEYMPFSGNGWSENKFISYQDIKKIIESKFKLKQIIKDSGEVANNYQLDGYEGKVGFISAISDHFCDSCNRLRITSEGNLKLCLFSPKNTEINLKKYLSDNSYTDIQIADIIESTLSNKQLKHQAVNELMQLDKNNMLTIGG
jgi:molybdenum cofactor biosynthesis protein A